MTDDMMSHRAAVVKDGWLGCPICRKKKHLLHVLEDTEARNLPVYCRSCKNRLMLDISRGQIVDCRVQWHPASPYSWTQDDGVGGEETEKTAKI